MTAQSVATPAPLPRNAAKRDAALAERFAAVGLRFIACEKSDWKSDNGLTRYSLHFLAAPELEDPALMRDARHGWEYHRLPVNGADNLDIATARPDYLAHLCYLVRMRAYDAALRDTNGGRMLKLTERLERAERDYGQAVARLAVAEMRGCFDIVKLAGLRKDADNDRDRLAACVKEDQAIRDRLAQLCPPVPAPDHDANPNYYYLTRPIY